MSLGKPMRGVAFFTLFAASACVSEKADWEPAPMPQAFREASSLPQQSLSAEIIERTNVIAAVSSVIERHAAIHDLFAMISWRRTDDCEGPVSKEAVRALVELTGEGKSISSFTALALASLGPAAHSALPDIIAESRAIVASDVEGVRHIRMGAGPWWNDAHCIAIEAISGVDPVTVDDSCSGFSGSSSLRRQYSGWTASFCPNASLERWRGQSE